MESEKALYLRFVMRLAQEGWTWPQWLAATERPDVTGVVWMLQCCCPGCQDSEQPRHHMFPYAMVLN